MQDARAGWAGDPGGAARRCVGVRERAGGRAAAHATERVSAHPVRSSSRRPGAGRATTPAPDSGSAAPTVADDHRDAPRVGRSGAEPAATSGGSIGPGGLRSLRSPGARSAAATITRAATSARSRRTRGQFESGAPARPTLRLTVSYWHSGIAATTCRFPARSRFPPVRRVPWSIIDPTMSFPAAPAHVHRSSSLAVTLNDGAAYDVGRSSAAIGLTFDVDLYGCPEVAV